MNTLFQSTLEEHLGVINSLGKHESQIDQIIQVMIHSLRSGGKIIWMGNGGSAADAQHLATELVVRFKRNRQAIASLALTTDTSLITACSNDFGFEQIFQRQIEAICAPTDVVVGISTSGNSLNLIKAIEAANRLGATTVGLLAKKGGKLCSLSSHSLVVDTEATDRAQEAHILIGHYICDRIEMALS